MSDIYEEAVADARKLRQKTTQVVEQQLLDKFRPKIDMYIERALLEASDDADDEEDILLGVDVAGPTEDAPTDDIAADVAASIEGGGDGEAAALQINSDGTVTLDLDKVVIPDAADAEQPPQDAAAAAAKPADAQTLTGNDVVESLTKLDAIRRLVDAVDDKAAAYKRLSEAFEKVARRGAPDVAVVDRAYIAAMTGLAERVNEAYVAVRSSNDIAAPAKDAICARFEKTYSRVNESLADAVCKRVAGRISKLERVASRTRTMNESRRRPVCLKVCAGADAMCRILEAVADRAGAKRVVPLKDRIATLVKEINAMTTRRKSLNEEEILLRIDVPDEETKSKIVAAVQGDSSDGDDDDLDMLLGDEGGDDDAGDDELDLDLEGDMGECGPGGAMESRSIADDLNSLFESDDESMGISLGGDEGGESEGGVDEGDDDEGGLDIDLGGDEGSDDSGDGAAAGVLAKIADIIGDVEGDASIEVVDDVGDGDGDDDDMGDDESFELDLGGDEGSEDSGGSDDEDVEEEGMDLGCEGVEDSELIEVDMNEVAAALREMDSSYHRQELAGPSKGVGDFGGGKETRELFADGEEQLEDVSEGRRPRNARMSDNRQSTPTARQVESLRRRLSESERKQAENNLLSAKLLYTNKLLQRSDLSEAQRGRIVAAMDKARNLREARLLYRNLVGAFDRRSARLSEGRRPVVGSSSRVTTSGGLSERRTSDVAGGDMLGESIDLDLWRRHAGLD